MKRIRSFGFIIGVLTLLLAIFFIFSDFILAGKGQQLGSVQLSIVMVCFGMSLCAFDFSLFWNHQRTLTWQDWAKSALLFLTGISLMILNNMFYSPFINEKENKDWVIKVLTQDGGILLILAGLWWRLQYTLISPTLQIAKYFKQITSVTRREENARWLPIIPLAFLSLGAVMAFRETNSFEVILAPVRITVLCFASLLTGLGLLISLLGKNQPLAIYLLAPVSGITVWALALGIGVGLRLPVWLVSIPLWCITIYFVWQGFDRQILQSIFPYFVIAFMLALLSTYIYALNGFSAYMGSYFADGWSYVAFGQYLWEYPRGLEGGLQPLYQYASHLSHTRYVSSSLLGFFSIITGKVGDTHAAFGFFFPFVFFAYASAIIAIALNKFSYAFSRFVFVTCTALSGWSFVVVYANNLDQSLALAYFPALAILAGNLHFNRPHWIIFLALITSASIYIYPELSPFVICSAILLFLEMIFLDKIPWRYWLPGALAAMVLVFIVLLPYLPELINFMSGQLAALSKGGVRHAIGSIPELLDYQYLLIALWGLGGNLMLGWAESFGFHARVLISLILSFFVGLGCLRLLKKRKLGSFAVVAAFIGTLLYYIVLVRYDYAAYKLFLLSSWFFFLVIVDELQYFIQIKRDFTNYSLKFIFTLIVIGFVAVFFIRVNDFAHSLPVKSVIPFRQLENIPISSDAALLISVNDIIPNEWAMYYLRNRSIFMYPFRGYATLPHVAPLMERAALLDISQIKFVLTGRNTIVPPGRQILWENEFYTLWKLPEQWVHIVAVENPNGIEMAESFVRFWLSNEVTVLDILAADRGTYTLSLETVQGPSLPESKERHVLITDSSGKKTIYIWHDGQHALPVSLLSGKNRLSIQVLDQPTIDQLPNGDTRKLLLGIRNIRIGEFLK